MAENPGLMVQQQLKDTGAAFGAVAESAQAVVTPPPPAAPASIPLAPMPAPTLTPPLEQV